MRTKLLIVLALSSIAFAQEDQKAKLLEQAAIAEHSGKLEAAEIAYCALAKLDKEYAAQCKLYSDVAEKERQRDLERLDTAKTAVLEHNFERARQQFSSVKTERAQAEAQDWLDNKLPAAQREWQQVQEQQRQKQQIANKINQAKQAIGNHDYLTAKDLLNTIDTPESRSLLTQISDQQEKMRAQQQYDQLVQSGDDSLSRGRLSEALGSYRKAVAMSQATEELRKKIDDTQAKLSAASNGTISGEVIDGSHHPISGASVVVGAGSGVGQSAYSGADGSFKITGIAPGSYLVTASKNGRELESRRIAVAAAEEVNVVLTGGGGSSGAATSDISSLVRAISTFYRDSPDDLRHAEWMLENYVAVGKRQALSQFYLGAARLSRYYLAGAKADDGELLRRAQDAFRRAKAISDFHPPKDISPRILKVYEETH